MNNQEKKDALVTMLLKEEFLAFLLIYASNVDFDFDALEKKRIIDLVGLPIYEQMLELFTSLSDFQALQVIMSHKEQYFNTSEQKDDILNLLKQQFTLDGEYSKLEVSFMNFLKHLME